MDYKLVIDCVIQKAVFSGECRRGVGDIPDMLPIAVLDCNSG